MGRFLSCAANTLKPIILVVIALVLVVNVSNGQNLDLVRKLREQLPAADPVKKFNILSAIGFEFRYSYPDSTIIYCNQAYDLGVQIGLKTDLSKPISFIGLAYANKGDYKNSFLYHQKSIDISLQQNDTIELAYGYNNLGRMFFDQGDLVRAFDNLIRSKEIFEDMKDRSGQAYVNRSIASVYSTQKDYGKALEMSRTALALRKEIGEPRMIVSSLMELGLIYQASGDTESALTYFLKADSASGGINDPVTRAELSIGLAEILVEQGELEEAFARTGDVFKTISEHSNQKMFLRATYLQAQYFHKKKQYDRAIPLLQKTLSTAEMSGNVLFQKNASYLLSEIYRNRNENSKAEEYNNRYRIFTGMLENTDLARQIERLQFQIEIEKKEKENEQLKIREVLNHEIIERQRLQNIILIIVIVSVVVIAAILYFNSRRRRMINHKLAVQNSHIVTQREAISRQNEDLSRSNQVLSDLNQEKNTLMNIVAHDLKSPLNRISGLTHILELEAGLSEDQKGYVSLIKESTRSGLDMITDLLDVNALEQVSVEPELKETQIGPLLKERVRVFQMAADSKAIQLNLKAGELPPVHTDASYLNRIVDNLLSNAIKFSSANSVVEVSAAVVSGKLQVSVKDSGPGFLEEDKPFLFQKFKKLSARPTGGESSNGLGLAIVKTLTDRLKGEIRLNTSRGRGSEFIITLPL